MTVVVHLHTYVGDELVVSTACGLAAGPGIKVGSPGLAAWVVRSNPLRVVCPRCLHAIGAPGTGRWGTPPEPPSPLDSHHLLALTSPLEEP
jgi:hypothetical protein